MSTHCRIGRVRMKAGGADVRVLETPTDRARRFIEQDFRKVVDGMPDIAGYAIVTWDHACRSVASMQVGTRSNIPSALVPDFVRNRLLADRIERWTIDTVNEQRGF